MKSLFLTIFCLLILVLPSRAQDENSLPSFPPPIELTDSQGLKSWLYTPANPDPQKPYWLVVSVHGAGNNGWGAMGLSKWVGKGDILVLGPSFAQPKNAPDASPEERQNAWKNTYQMAAPLHAQKLQELIAQIGKQWKIHPKIYLSGFSAGAQFVHRYAMKYPQNVLGVASHSAGSWTTKDGNAAGEDKINPDAKNIPFAVSCGEDDKGSGGPNTKRTRLEGAKAFSAELESLGFPVQLRTFPGVGHQFTSDTEAFTWESFESARKVEEKVQTIEPQAMQ